MAITESILAGFGGQGIMLMGQLMAYAGMLDGKYVTWIPSYGPETRGGTANCHVVVSDEEIACPLITSPDVAVVMNRPSLDKFEPMVKPGGLLVLNESLIDRKPKREDITVFKIPANNIAEEVGSSKVANMVVFGALLELTKVVEFDSVVKSLEKLVGKRHAELIPMNKEALQRGIAYAQEFTCD